MKSIRSRAGRLGVLAFVLGAAVAAAVLTASSSHATARGGMTPALGAVPKYQRLDALNAGSVAPANQPGRLRQCQLANTCYGPDQLRNAYGVTPLLDRGITGAGRTIVIIDAYGSDTLQADFNTNSAYWGLPQQTITQVFPDGPPSATTPANRGGWKGETTLDVNTAHAIAPDAKIVLVVAKSNDDADILSATQYVQKHDLGDVVSQSYGEAEQCMDPTLLSQQNKLFAKMTEQGITLIASSGDDGAAQPACDGNGDIKAASTPASDPNVTGIGGTDLTATPPTGTQPTSTSASPSFEVTPGGTYEGETVWNEGPGLASGGGFSVVYKRPFYQVAANRTSRMRGVPDISWNASFAHSTLVIMSCTAADTSACGAAGTFVFGFAGTSAGSPQVAGVVALADQAGRGRIGLINPTLYALGALPPIASQFFHDVTVGDNSVPADPSTPGTPITGFAATPGWDAATGLGSPRSDRLVPALAASRFFRDGGGDH